MCTSICFHNGGLFFGRNMDLDGSFGERVVISPRNFELGFHFLPVLSEHYAYIGTAAMAGGYPLYADAVNEKGLCISSLRFLNNAYYPESTAQGKTNLAPYELIPYIMAKCDSVAQAKKELENLHFVAEPFSADLPLAPLHWLIADEENAIVLESTEQGLFVYDNPVGVLTNNPPFDYHLQNLKLYEGLSNRNPENAFLCGDASAQSLGLGAVGLPGDFSSQSRFVKAAFLLGASSNIKGEESVSHVFNMLSSVAVPKGAVLTENKKEHYTTYSCCMDAQKGKYYIKTYGSCIVHCFDLAGNENADEPLQYEL